MENGTVQSQSDAVSQDSGAETGTEAEAKVKSEVPEDIFSYYEKMDHEDEETELQTVSFEINQDHLEKLQKRFLPVSKLFLVHSADDSVVHCVITGRNNKKPTNWLGRRNAGPLKLDRKL